MKAGLKAAVVTTAAAGLLIGFWLLYDAVLYDFVPSSVWFVCMILGIAAAVVAVGMWISLLVHALSKKRINPHAVFGVLAGLAAVSAAIYGLYDMTHPKELFGGLSGGISLYIFAPALAALVGVDIAVYFIRKYFIRKNKKN